MQWDRFLPSVLNFKMEECVFGVRCNPNMLEQCVRQGGMPAGQMVREAD